MATTKSDFRIYLDWLDEVNGLLQRLHEADPVGKAVLREPIPNLCDELRTIAGELEDNANQLRTIADAVQHIEYQLNRYRGITDGNPNE